MRLAWGDLLQITWWVGEHFDRFMKQFLKPCPCCCRHTRQSSQGSRLWSMRKLKFDFPNWTEIHFTRLFYPYSESTFVIRLSLDAHRSSDRGMPTAILKVCCSSHNLLCHSKTMKRQKVNPILGETRTNTVRITKSLSVYMLSLINCDR